MSLVNLVAGNMEQVTAHDFLDIGARMAQDLQEYIDEAENAGCKNPFPGTAALIDEWEKLHKKSNQSMAQIADRKRQHDEPIILKTINFRG